MPEKPETPETPRPPVVAKLEPRPVTLEVVEGRTVQFRIQASDPDEGDRVSCA